MQHHHCQRRCLLPNAGQQDLEAIEESSTGSLLMDPEHERVCMVISVVINHANDRFQVLEEGTLRHADRVFGVDLK